MSNSEYMRLARYNIISDTHPKKHDKNNIVIPYVYETSWFIIL